MSANLSMAQELEKIAFCKVAFIHGDPQALAVAQQRISELWCQLLTMYLLYWDAHWKAEGPQQQGDHQLFSRLYGEVSWQLDGLAEKFIGYFGAQAFSLPEFVNAAAQKLAELMSSGEDYVHMSMTVEDEFQSLLRQAHGELTQLGVLPLGFDDWLMATASSFEQHSYLLQQRAVGGADDMAQLEAQEAAADPKLLNPKAAAKPKGKEKKAEDLTKLSSFLSFFTKKAPGALEQGADLMKKVHSIAPSRTGMESAQAQLKLMKNRKSFGMPAMGNT